MEREGRLLYNPETQVRKVNPEERFVKLQHDLKRGDTDCKMFAIETKAAITKQHTQIDNLQNKYNALKENIVMQNEEYMGRTGGFNTTGFDGKATVDYIRKYQQEEDRYQMNLRNIKIIEENIGEKKKEIGGVNAGLENQNSLLKQIKILENRLDKANQKFNEAISVNKSLRQQIDSLRRERVIFDNLYKKLEKELHDKRKKMAEIIETANNAYEERDKANDQIDNLRSKAKREAKDFENDLREITQRAETNRAQIEILQKVNQNQHDRGMDMGGDGNQQMEKTNKGKSSKGLRSQNIDPQLQEKHEKLRLDFSKIQAATQIKSFHTLLDTFKEMEEKNFEKFKFVIEQSNQIEFLEHQIGELKEEMKKYQGKSNGFTPQKNKHLKELDDRSLTSQQKAQFFESKYNNSLKILNSINNLVENVFNELECDKLEANKLNGVQAVTESNLLTYLGIVEKRLTLVLDLYGDIASKVK